MAVEEFKLPDVGEGVAEGELVNWLVAPGDRVEEGQPVAEVETDKALVEVPSRYDGVVEELFAEPGQIVPVGDVIISFRVDEEDEEGSEAAESEPAEATAETAGPEAEASAEPAASDPDAAPDAEPETPAGRTFAPPSARRLARELGVDIADVDGSAPSGRVSEADVRAHAEGDADGSSESDSAAPEPKPTPTPTDLGSDGRTSAVSKRGEAGAATDPTGSTSSASPEPAGRDTTLATPATRKVARELDVDLDDVPTDETRDGEAFVTEADVRAYAEALEAPEPAETAPEPEPVDTTATADAGGAGAASGTTADATSDGAAAAAASASGDAVDETVPYRGVRRTIGKQMERSKFTAPHVTHHDTAAVDALVEARERLKPAAEERGVSLTYMPFVMKAIVAGLKEHPYLNSELREDDEEIVLKREYNIGIAVATDAGLMVPVVEDVDEKGLFELASEVRDLATRARDRQLSPDEMKGGTFTITNFGAIGGEYATPIINYPETAILGLGAIEERPVVRDGEVVAAPTLPLSLSIDHRVIDGAIAAEFANTVMDRLETPLLLLNE